MIFITEYMADFEYKDFREHFTCEMFEPKEWAALFKRSGAKICCINI